MPAKIFISYRRDDVPGDARSIRDGLAAKFGKSNVFMDVDDLLPGQRFDRQLAKALDACDVLIAVIGPRWMEPLRHRLETGAADYVRAEIAEALTRGIAVIPVRVGREGQMPDLPNQDELPDDVRDLVLHQRHDVTHERFGRDMIGLVAGIRTLRQGRPRQVTITPWAQILLIGSAAALLLAAQPAYRLGLWWLEERRWGNMEAGRSILNADRIFRDCLECPEMAIVPAGSFVMGSPDAEEGRDATEGPQRRVTITRSFAVGRFSVTFEEWDACTAADGCKGYRPTDWGFGRGRQPVIDVSWLDAKAYAAWLSSRTGKAYRVLSEAEREYVTRAGTTTPYWWGSSIAPGHANYKHNHWQQTVPVHFYGANPWGLYHVHGNVWEWVEDCWSNSYHGAPTDGSAWTANDCLYRVIRGGSFYENPEKLRSASRTWGMAQAFVRRSTIGFRVARALD